MIGVANIKGTVGISVISIKPSIEYLNKHELYNLNKIANLMNRGAAGLDTGPFLVSSTLKISRLL